MSVIKTHDINSIKVVLPFAKVEPGTIVKHVEDSQSFGTIVSIEYPPDVIPNPGVPFFQSASYPRENPQLPSRDVTVLWTKEPKILQVQFIKNRTPSPIKTQWAIEVLEDFNAYNSMDGNVRICKPVHRQFIVEETYEQIDTNYAQELLSSGADIEVNIDGSAIVRRNLPFTEENIRKYNALRGIHTQD